MSRLWGIAISTILILAACAMFRNPEKESVEVTPTNETPVVETTTVRPTETAAVRVHESLKFDELLTDTKAKLPTRDILQGKPAEELHQPPQEVLDIGLEFGKIHEALKEDPRLVSAGALFFGECASQDDLLTSVRAVCLRNARYYEKKDPTVKLALRNVPQDVERIAGELPEPSF